MALAGSQIVLYTSKNKHTKNNRTMKSTPLPPKKPTKAIPLIFETDKCRYSFFTLHNRLEKFVVLGLYRTWLNIEHFSIPLNSSVWNPTGSKDLDFISRALRFFFLGWGLFSLCSITGAVYLPGLQNCRGSPTSLVMLIKHVCREQ